MKNLTPDGIISAMLCAYGEEEINVQNCHATSWMVYDQFHEKLDLQIILGVVPGYYPYPGRRVGPEPIAHSWVETPGLLIDTNPQAVAYWTEEFWIDEATPAPRLNLKAIRKADLGGLKYYRKVEEALAQPQLLGGAAVLLHQKRWRFGRRYCRHAFDAHLDIAVKHGGIDRLRRAVDNDASHFDDVLWSPIAGGSMRLGRQLRVEHTLDRSGAVPQVDEDQPTEITAMPYPSLEAHLCSDLLD